MSKVYIKRILCLILALVMVLAVAGCGEDKTNPYKDNSSNSSGSSDDSQADGIQYNKPLTTIGPNGKDYADYDPYADAEKYKGTTVKFATWINHQNTEGAKPINDFKEKYGINVELVYCSQNKYVEELLALISAGNSPDVFVDGAMFPFTLQVAEDFAVSGVDLNEPIWSRASLNSSTVGNKVYSVNTINSVWAGTKLCVYNRELMESNGIKTPSEYYEEGNWTWETMKEVMKQVDALGDDYHGGTLDIMDVIGPMGTDLVSYDFKNAKFKSNITNPDLAKAMNLVLDLSKDNLLTSGSDFELGRVGIIIEDPYAIKRTGYFKSMDGLDLGVTYVPDWDANKKSVFASNIRGYGIVKGSKNPKAAGMFIRYFLDAANYDLNDTFLSDDLANFFFEMSSKVEETAAEQPVLFNYTGIAMVSGQSSWTWVQPVYGVDPSQVAATLAAQQNLVDTAVTKANELIAKYK